MHLFVSQGIKSVKMDDIANHLSISKRTLYEIYSNKEDLLFESCRRGQKIKQQQMVEALKDSKNVMDILLKVYRIKVEEFRTIHPSFFSDLEKYPRLIEYFEKMNVEMREQQLAFIRRGIDEGFFRSDVNYPLVMSILDASHRYVMKNHIYDHYSMEEVFHNSIFFSLRGFCTLKGVEVLDRFMDEEYKI